MRMFRTVYMRGGTSKGCMFLKEDLPEREQWDDIFLQVMGNPDPKQIDGMGGTVSSNNKIVVMGRSNRSGIDADYLVGQVIVGKKQVDYASNCGNMTAAAAAYAVEAGLVFNLTEPVTTVHLYNENTDRRIDVMLPVRGGRFYNEGTCSIAGVDGTAGELRVGFLDPAGSKTGCLLPTGHVRDHLMLGDGSSIEATILDVSNPIVLVRAEDIGVTGLEMPDAIDHDKQLNERLERIRGAACVQMGFAEDLEDATKSSPAVPKVGFVARPGTYRDIAGKTVLRDEMDIAARVISVFKCHKACPLTSASAISVAAFLPGSVVAEMLQKAPERGTPICIGHPSGIITMYPELDGDGTRMKVHSVAVQRTARRIMDGFVYIRD
ncbi:MAG: PrpF protein [Christensenellaceae bacterium]|nr:PrpF protein [Christensenellaceae bacterium]